jgi:mannitol-1-/sugar-/sorbitol-6-/2-deoxyglucose-6-phosphatase
MSVKAVIFDMDGLLINSEPIWREAEKKVFATVGITLTDEMCFQTVGLRIDEVVDYWFHKFPWKDKSLEKVKEEVIEGVISLVKQRGEALPGVYEVLDFFDKKRIPMGIASASSLSIINEVVDKLNIRQRFKIIHSAELEEYGKPHPAVYLSAAKLMSVVSYECLVFEDSFNGIVAARAARMKVIAVPEDIHYGEPHFAAAHVILKSLTEFTELVWEKISK